MKLAFTIITLLTLQITVSIIAMEPQKYQVQQIVLKNHGDETCCIIQLSLDADMNISASHLTTTIYTDDPKKNSMPLPTIASLPIVPLHRHRTEYSSSENKLNRILATHNGVNEFIHDITQRYQNNNAQPLSELIHTSLQRAHSQPCTPTTKK